MRYPKQLFQRNLKLAQGFGLLCLCAWWLMAAVPVQAAGSICTVGISGATHITIQEAVSDSGCTTINVAAGTYEEHVLISRKVTINGATAASTIVGGDPAAVSFPTVSLSIFTIVTGEVTLNNLIIQFGAGQFPNGPPMSSYTRGGGIYNTGTLYVNNSTIKSNVVKSYGENSGFSKGGGIYNAGMLVLNNSTLSGNKANLGGGIYNTGAVRLDKSTLSGNSANIGGGIYNDAGEVQVYNSTLSGNKATTGSGIYSTVSVHESTVHLINSTLFDNGITAIEIDNGSPRAGLLSLKNSIIATYSPEDSECYGQALPDSGNNLLRNNLVHIKTPLTGLGPALCGLPRGYGDNTTSSSVGYGYGNLIGYDPKLGALKVEIRGKTATHGLLSGSPAIDKGDKRVCFGDPISHQDQRGVERPLMASWDDAYAKPCAIGAYEGIDTGASPVSLIITTLETTIVRQTIANTDARFDFVGSSSDLRVASYECRLDNAAFATCTSPQTYKNLSVSTHTFQVRATNEPGFVDASPASYTWTASNPNGCYQIRSMADNRLLTVPNNNGDRALKVAAAQSSNALQLWNLRSDGAIGSLRTKYVVDVNGVSQAVGAAAIVYPENVPATLNQHWTLNQRENGYVAITTKLNGYVLDVSGQDGVSVILYPEKTTDFANQRWLFVAQPADVCAAATVPTATNVTSASLAETSTETVPTTLPSAGKAAAAQPLAATSQIFLPLVSHTEAVHTVALAAAPVVTDTTGVTDPAPPVLPTVVDTAAASITTTRPVTEPASLTLTQPLSLPAVALPVTSSVPVEITPVVTATLIGSVPVAAVVTATQAGTTTQLLSATEGSEQNNKLFLPVINNADLAGTALGSPSALGSLGLVVLVLIGGGGVWLYHRRTRR